MSAITNTVIGPGSRVSVTVTNKYNQTKTYTATAIQWMKSGMLQVRTDEGGVRQQKKSVSSDSVKLIK